MLTAQVVVVTWQVAVFWPINHLWAQIVLNDDTFFAPDNASVDVFRVMWGKRAYRLLGLLGYIFMVWKHLGRHYCMTTLLLMSTSSSFLSTFISNLVTTRELLLFLLLLPGTMLILSAVALLFILCQINCTDYNCVLNAALLLCGYVSRSLSPLSSLNRIQILNLSLAANTVLTSVELAVESFDWHAMLSLST